MNLYSIIINLLINQIVFSSLALFHTFLPSKESCGQLTGNFIVLISRVLVQRIPVFRSYKDVVPNHIPHQYASEMLLASEMVSFIYNKWLHH